MNWFKRKVVDAIPNPRDKRRQQEYFTNKAQLNVLRGLQFLVFALAILILLEVA